MAGKQVQYDEEIRFRLNSSLFNRFTEMLVARGVNSSELCREILREALDKWEWAEAQKVKKGKVAK